MMWLRDKRIGWTRWIKQRLGKQFMSQLAALWRWICCQNCCQFWQQIWQHLTWAHATHRVMNIWQRMREIGKEPAELEMIRATHIASADTLWRIVNNLADLETWHPLVTSTNAPRGQQAKPGLMYRTMSRYLPLSTQVFVERVLPGELVSMRLFPLPGLQERVTYRIVSTLCGTCVLYSITLSGWLSPFAWPVVKPQVTKVAAALVAAAEMETTEQWREAGEQSGQARPNKKRSPHKADIFD